MVIPDEVVGEVDLRSGERSIIVACVTRDKRLATNRLKSGNIANCKQLCGQGIVRQQNTDEIQSTMSNLQITAILFFSTSPGCGASSPQSNPDDSMQFISQWQFSPDVLHNKSNQQPEGRLFHFTTGNGAPSPH
jgi:hypothetical protein